MIPIYVDIHIHTSENPNLLNNNYDVETLLKNIEKYCGDKNFLISFSDHNTINKAAYLSLVNKHPNVLLGAELHIQYSEETAPYHCHIIFDVDVINSKIIDSINDILNKLYENKEITPETKNVPHIEEIVQSFDSFEFMLLPHGGQSHSTFHKAIPDGKNFDTTMERSIYYNQFDGFTARSDKKLETSISYFQKLGIDQFINLITCSDNYNLHKYPEPKDSKASEFIPTWILSQPTYAGLRLALSESSRLVRHTKPQYFSETIGNVSLKNDFVDIDIELLPGLNVVIGSSSSGKTLLVDSIYNCITNNYDKSKYRDFGVDQIQISNPSELTPHYLHQNYIVDLVNESSGKGINEIEIIKRLFPDDKEINKSISNKLTEFNNNLSKLYQCVNSIETLQQDITHITTLSKLVVTDILQDNILQNIIPDQKLYQTWEYSEIDYLADIEYLKKMSVFLEANPFTKNQNKHIEILKSELEYAYNIGVFESQIRNQIIRSKKNLDLEINTDKRNQREKRNEYQKLINKITEYINELNNFYDTLKTISEISLVVKTQEKESLGHKLFIENKFTLSKERFLEVLNNYLKKKISSIDEIEPSILFKANYDGRLKIKEYDDIKEKIFNDFTKLNKRKYRIITSQQKDFDNLSAGWKTSVLLDLILGYKEDIAPLIIDQPEDNLATDYINSGLIESIKKAKSMKQIILVSHNATIPMLGDAQNVIVCENVDKIIIRNSPLEGRIGAKTVVDYIAEVTDGGKPSIKKRFKKYNLKSYRGTK